MGLETFMGDSIITSTIADVIKWGRKNSLYPLPFGTACCAIEFMSSVSSVFDLARFGAEVIRFSPRQSDLIIVAGTITFKQAPILKRIYDQMPEPKWVISVGACASSGGFYDNYCTVQGIDQIVPVDAYIAGCPPRPEAIIDAVIRIQEIIDKTGTELTYGQNKRTKIYIGDDKELLHNSPKGAPDSGYEIKAGSDK